MYKQHKYFLSAIAFVVLSALQLSAHAQAPAKKPAKKPAPIELKTEKKPEAGPGQSGRFNVQSIPPSSDTTHTLTRFFTPATGVKKAPNPSGFIQRWLVLEPVKNNRSNSTMTESYLKTTLATDNFSQDYNVVPKDRQIASIGGKDLKWYGLDSKSFDFNLFHFSYATNNTRNGVLFWLVTVINCDQDIKNVKLSAGVNSAGMFWVNGKEVLVIPGDENVISDSATSPLLTLKKGKNIIRAAVMNGQGMVTFCARFLDANGEPVKNYTITCE